ncbi:MAG: Rrf2 family transcriptional regulator [Hyphomicrobiales bacterium]|nr:Rrf2 family transcriptional regulator [Hyphomicrobiales bacterium]OQW84104.1 MAG: hypothetical protein BVN31_04050 [Proteobacteria bacterium ST_bin15]
MVLSRRVILALLAICDIALHARASRVSARELSQRYQLPPRHFESILQDLTRAGIIRGQRGPKGGYELAVERRRLPISAILEAVYKHPDNDILPPDGLAARLVGSVVEAADQRLKSLLSDISIDDVLERSTLKAEVNAGDFSI